MTTAEENRGWEPKFPLAVAALIFVLGALTLCYPILQGQMIAGEDQLVAGYAFRLFGSDFFKEYGSIPQWNPYLFGGMPFSAVIGHGDIFYPTAWLRWFVPVDFGMSFGFFFHIALAGVSMYSLVRAFRMSWTAALVAGVAYQLSGNVASMLNNGHDGKLFVAALAPFAFLALINAIRYGKRSGYGYLALVIGLAILSPQVQVAYYLMVASGIFALWLVFYDPERRTGKNPWLTLTAALGAVLLGLGISMIQILPILSHVKYTPRAVSGASTGWDYAIQYALPIPELTTIFLPEFAGMDRAYVGGNPVKSHTEYLGVIIVILAIIGITAARKKRMLLPFGAIGGLFLLVSFGSHTPFYRLWYTFMPMMDKVRAAGMAFYLVGLCTAVLAAFGIEALRKGEVTSKKLNILLGVFAGIALLGAAGGLMPLSEAFARDGMIQALLASNPQVDHFKNLQGGSIRLLLFVLVGGGVLVGIQRAKLSGALAAAALVLVVGSDSWSILHHFSAWGPPASERYAEDPVSANIKKTPLPYRVFQPSGDQFGGASVYYASIMMAHRIPGLFGYQGMESVYFDALLGGKNLWTNQLDPKLWELYAVNHILINQEVDSFPGVGFHKTMGPVAANDIRGGVPAHLFERDTAAPWVRVIPRGVAVPQDQMIPTLLDPTFPYLDFVLFSDTAGVNGTTKSTERPGPVTIKASLTDWKPGAMTVRLEGSDSVINWLLVAENWYPDWHATVDGTPAQVARGDQALIAVAIPPGAKEIALVFDVAEYHQGKWITLISVLLAFGIIFSSRVGRRTADV